MVACVALSSIQPPNILAVQMTTSTQTVEELKTRLLFAVENDKEELCDTLLDDLRKAVTTREILEVTRVGFHVNNVRRNYLKKWPVLSKKCRDIIKAWQDFVGEERSRPHSGASSANTTPCMTSPSVAKLARRGITPNTPLNRRVTSTGLQGRISATVSPANGSYAPPSQISPLGAPSTSSTPAPNGHPIHKSQSVGGELLNHNEKSKDDTTNKKRKAADETAQSSAIKRIKTTAGSLASPTVTSVSAARKAVLSTKDLVAALSQNLPEHMNIDSTIREHEERVKREHKDEELAQQLQATVSAAPPERKKRKYEKKSNKKEQLQQQQAPPPARAYVPDNAPRGGIVLKLSRNGTSGVQVITRPPLPPPEAPKSVAKETTSPPKFVDNGIDEVDGAMPSTSSVANTTAVAQPAKSRRKDWSSLIPSMADLKIRAERDEKETGELLKEVAQETKSDPTRVQKVKNYRRPILMLPYLDNPLGPDFIVHKYRNSLQYYSEDNFKYGDKRPDEQDAPSKSST